MCEALKVLAVPCLHMAVLHRTVCAALSTLQLSCTGAAGIVTGVLVNIMGVSRIVW
jgi:hypothetical protein